MTLPISSSTRVTYPDQEFQFNSEQLDRLDNWTQAFDLWLDSRRSENTRRAYFLAWEQFLRFTPKFYWEVSKSDIARWVDDLRSQGLSPETIQQRLAALSSFYTYTNRVYTLVTPDGREQPLHNFNPVQAVPRPKVSHYNKAHYLSVAETRAFLHAIPRDTLQGLRDYALFLAYLATGRRNSEIRLLRWGNFELESLPSLARVERTGEFSPSPARMEGTVEFPPSPARGRGAGGEAVVDPKSWLFRKFRA
jgi:site-specific recombinase XerD